MSSENKDKPKKEQNTDVDDNVCNLNEKYTKKCSINNKQQLNTERENHDYLSTHTNENEYLYPILDDPNFNIKIAKKKEFMDTKYDGSIHPVEKHANMLKTAEYELLPQQAFVRNFLSFQTPYNSLLLFHGLGSGKTCSAIGVCEEMRDYLRQMGINKRIIIVASPNVQDNFKLQLFDERKLKEVDGIWTMKGCLGNKLLKEINPTGMKGLKREKVIQQVKQLINSSYSFQGYVQFSNEIVRISGNPEDSKEIKARNLEFEYSDRLIVIDEVHNIRISDDNENKNVAKNLMYLVSVVSNIRLLLLSATPMFNSYKEIIWILNLMNINDRRGIISVSDVFNKDGSWKKNKDDKEGEETGKQILIRKATGYVSYVRGENPYTFPFRIYPDQFAYSNTFQGNIYKYPIYQINGTKIPQENKEYPIKKLSLFLNAIGDYQRFGYKYIISRLRSREEGIKITRKGTEKKMAAFSALKSFGYTDLQIPIEALNIIYPHDGLKELVEQMPKFEYVDDEEEEVIEIAPITGKPEKELVEEIQNVMDSGPSSINAHPRFQNSEIESEPVATEGLDGDIEDELTSFKPFKSLSKSSVKPSEASSSFKGSLKKKTKGTHIVEGNTKSIYPSEKIGGGDDSSNEKRIDYLNIDPKDLTGAQGLKRIMNYDDTKTNPAFKGNFEYKKDAIHVFENDKIGDYSSKIKNVCNYIYNKDTNKVSDGIILIYSSYIDAGLIPMALALEEMGFTRYGEKAHTLFKTEPVPVVDVRTMKPPTSRKDFKPARYVMITGDTRLSPNNDADIKAITKDDNIYKEDKNGNIVDISGEIIKVVLISQAGSEGLDFKAIRQIHILEPWYNINRIEQIIGRGVRNFSHKDLPFKNRNVQIFLYGTILDNSEEESADLYVYRVAETKAVKIGKVTRLLKQTAVDCIINHDQTKFTPENFQENEENKNVKQELSNHQIIDDYKIGDKDNSATCDFMECEFKCLPTAEIDETKLNNDTYNETFMLVNSDKIIQKIRLLMKIRYFYKKKDLFDLINSPKKYPDEQIYSALTQMITDNSEYITDKYGRTGYLINIGDYYLFQPSELNFKNISVYDRSVPINYKHSMVKFKIKTNIAKPVIDKRNLVDEVVEEEIVEEKPLAGKTIFDTMFSNYMSASNSESAKKGEKNWYENCGVVIRKMVKEDLLSGFPEQKRLEILSGFLIKHIVDSLMMDQKIELLNFICANNNCKQDDFDLNVGDEQMKRFYNEVAKYLLSKRIVYKGLIALLIYNGSSKKDNQNIFILKNNVWEPALSEDIRELTPVINKKYELKNKSTRYIGFIGFKKNALVYKIKDTDNKRSTGFFCVEAGKQKIMDILNYIENDEKYISKITKDGLFELCVRQEFTFRGLEFLEEQKPANERTVYFVDTETAIYNEFEKKEKEK
jgi:hypothetical protein